MIFLWCCRGDYRNPEKITSGNYEQTSFNESYENGRLSLNQQMTDYDGYNGYKQRSEYTLGTEQNNPAAQSYLDYGRSAVTDIVQDDLVSDYGRRQGTSDYDQSSKYSVGRDQASLSRRPPSGYEQRLTDEYLREQEIANRQTSVSYGQNSVADRNPGRGSAVGQSPFAVDRTGSAYSSVSK